MLDRNRRIKKEPERFQLSKERFHIIITCEERVYDQVLESKYYLTHHPFLVQVAISHTKCKGPYI